MPLAFSEYSILLLGAQWHYEENEKKKH